MEQKYKVVLSYLESINASTTIPDDQKSKEDPAKQTQAVEKLIRDTLNKHLPEYRDKCLAVGGFVRDQLLGKNPKDIDLVVDDPDTEMKAAEIFCKKFAEIYGITTPNNPHPLKEAYGIWGLVLFNPKGLSGDRKPFVYDGVDITGYIIEVTPPRKEGPYDPIKREPKYVSYTSRSEDARRRDLTINALYKNIATGDIEDYVGGKEDLAKKTLRPPEHPDGIEAIYREDPLRIFRILRFSGKLGGFKISPETEKTLKEFINSPAGRDLIKNKVSPERIRDEFQQIITHPDATMAVNGLELMRDYNLLSFLSPHLDKLIDLYHDKVFHKGESVWQHTMDVLKKTPPTVKARLSALLHDIGKLDTMTQSIDSKGRERVQFKGHESKGLPLAESILRELKFPSDIINSVKGIIHSHMGFKDIGEQRASTLLRKIRIFIEKLYNDLDDAIAILKADARDDEKEITELSMLEKRIRDQITEDLRSGVLQKKDKGVEYRSPLSGDQIMAEYSNVKGRALGAVKSKLKQLLMEGQFKGLSDQDMADKAKKLLKGMVINEKNLDSMVNNYVESREDFYKI